MQQNLREEFIFRCELIAREAVGNCQVVQTHIFENISNFEDVQSVQKSAIAFLPSLIKAPTRLLEGSTRFAPFRCCIVRCIESGKKTLEI